MSEDLAIDVAIREAFDRVNALFVEHREVTPEERTFHVAGFRFVTFCNGNIKAEGEPATPTDTLRHAVDRTIRAVSSRFPDHAAQQVVWRCLPEASDKPLGLYMRLTATPLAI